MGMLYEYSEEELKAMGLIFPNEPETVVPVELDGAVPSEMARN